MLTGASLKSKMMAKLEAKVSGWTETTAESWGPVCEALAEAMIEELTTNAVVNPTSLQDSVPAAVTGTGTIS